MILASAELLNSLKILISGNIKYNFLSSAAASFLKSDTKINLVILDVPALVVLYELNNILDAII